MYKPVIHILETVVLNMVFMLLTPALEEKEEGPGFSHL